jgi:hypothetical protein
VTNDRVEIPEAPRLIARLRWRELLSPRYAYAAAAHTARLVWRDPVLRAVLILVLAVDGAFILLHWYQELDLDTKYRLAWLDPAKLNMIKRDSYLTVFDHLKAIATVIFLARAWVATRAAAYVCSGLAFLVVLLISTSVLHANLAERLARFSGLVAVYPEMASHMVEAAILAAIGALLLALIAIGALRSEGIHSVFAVAMAVAIAGIGFFAGGVDLFHALMFFELRDIVRVLAFIEEAGEAVVQSVACLFAAAIASRCAPLGRSG